MSRDWTPLESYLVEQQGIKEGRGDKWDFMRGLVYHPIGKEPYRVVSDEEIELRKQYPIIGKFAGNFLDLYRAISTFDGGLEFLRQKDAEIAEFIDTGKGDSDSYLVKWFEGRLDESFYYRERNDELLLDAICREAQENGLCNWVITDSDCMQVRRQVEFEIPGVYQLMQIDAFPLDNGDCVYRLASAQIDLSDYSHEERMGVLSAYGFNSMKEFASAVGDYRTGYSQLAEMFFETSAAEFYVKEFTSWNNALSEIEERTGLSLERYKEVGAISISGEEMEAFGIRGAARLRQQAKEDIKALDEQIEQCAAQVSECAPKTRDAEKER